MLPALIYYYKFGSFRRTETQSCISPQCYRGRYVHSCLEEGVDIAMRCVVPRNSCHCLDIIYFGKRLSDGLAPFMNSHTHGKLGKGVSVVRVLGPFSDGLPFMNSHTYARQVGQGRVSYPDRTIP